MFLDWAKLHAVALSLICMPLLAMLPGLIAHWSAHRSEKLVAVSGLGWLLITTWAVWMDSRIAIYAGGAWMALMLWAFSARSELHHD